MKTGKRSIYLRVLAGLSALWIVFFAAFSLFEIDTQRERDLSEVYGLLTSTATNVEELMRKYEDQPPVISTEVPLSPEAERNTFIALQLQGITQFTEVELGYFDIDQNLICSSAPLIPVSYQVPYRHTPQLSNCGYGLIDLYDTLPEETAETVLSYTRRVSEDQLSAMENGEIAGYSVFLSLWTDGQTCIPKSIGVYPHILLRGDGWTTVISANSAEDAVVREQGNGNVEIWLNGSEEATTSSSDGQQIITIHGGASSPTMAEDGSIVSHGGWSPVWVYENTPEESEIAGMTLAFGYQFVSYHTASDKALLSQAQDGDWLYSRVSGYYAGEESRLEALDISRRSLLEKDGFFTTNYYAVLETYRTQVNASGNYPYHYLVAAGRVHPLRDALPALVWIALGSLLLFLLVGAILCHQLGKTYDKERALEAQRRRTTNAMAHDLKTPMAAILALSDNLVEHTRPEKEAHYIQSLRAQTLRMNDIVIKMLDLSRLEAGVDTLRPETFHLASLCQQAIAASYQGDQRFLITGDAEITADREMLLRVMDNLLSNAVKYTPKGGMVEISITPGRCAVKNPGAPIPEDALPHLFEAYYQADDARGSGGSGLGLAIVKEILDRHGFTCGAENQNGAVVFWFNWR